MEESSGPTDLLLIQGANNENDMILFDIESNTVNISNIIGMGMSTELMDMNSTSVTSVSDLDSSIQQQQHGIEGKFF